MKPIENIWNQLNVSLFFCCPQLAEQGCGKADYTKFKDVITKSWDGIDQGIMTD